MHKDMLFAFLMGFIGASPLLVVAIDFSLLDMIVLVPLAVLWARVHKWQVVDKEGSAQEMKYFAMLVICLLAACGGTADVGQAEGELGGACYGNSTCDGDLLCVDDVCESEETLRTKTVLGTDGGVLEDDSGIGGGSFDHVTSFQEVTASLDKVVVSDKDTNDSAIDGHGCYPDRGCDYLVSSKELFCETSDNDYTCEIQCVKVDACEGMSQYGTCCLPIVSYERVVSFDLFKDIDSKTSGRDLLSTTPKSVTLKVHNHTWSAVDRVEILIGGRVLAETGPVAFGDLPIIQLTEWDTNKARDALRDALLDYETPFSLTVRVWSTLDVGTPNEPVGKFRFSASVAFSATY